MLHTPRHHEITCVTIHSQCGGEIYYMKVKILCAHELLLIFMKRKLIWCENPPHIWFSIFKGRLRLTWMVEIFLP
jgi:hypothetical protein